MAETATQIFITGGDRANVAGIVLAGSAEFKNELSESDIFDPRLKAIVLAVVDVSYGTSPGQKTFSGLFLLLFSSLWGYPWLGFYMCGNPTEVLLMPCDIRGALPISCQVRGSRSNGGYPR